MSSENASEMQIHNRSNNEFYDQFRMKRRKSEQRMKYRRVKKNGCFRPFHRFQIISYVYFSLNTVLFYITIPMSFDIEAKVASIALFTFITLCTCLCVLKATLIVPTDPFVLQEIELQLHDQSFMPEAEHNFCYVCEAHCSHNSKHCSQCDRCIIGFDHHCIWLNNCIGKKNYKWFFCGIVFMTFLMMLQNCLNIASISLFTK